jgi:hypothetical protein
MTVYNSRKCDIFPTFPLTETPQKLEHSCTFLNTFLGKKKPHRIPHLLGIHWSFIGKKFDHFCSQKTVKKAVWNFQERFRKCIILFKLKWQENLTAMWHFLVQKCVKNFRFRSPFWSLQNDFTIMWICSTFSSF